MSDEERCVVCGRVIEDVYQRCHRDGVYCTSSPYVHAGGASDG